MDFLNDVLCPPPCWCPLSCLLCLSLVLSGDKRTRHPPLAHILVVLAHTLATYCIPLEKSACRILHVSNFGLRTTTYSGYLVNLVIDANISNSHAYQPRSDSRYISCCCLFSRCLQLDVPTCTTDSAIRGPSAKVVAPDSSWTHPNTSGFAAIR